MWECVCVSALQAGKESNRPGVSFYTQLAMKRANVWKKADVEPSESFVSSARAQMPREPTDDWGETAPSAYLRGCAASPQEGLSQLIVEPEQEAEIFHLQSHTEDTCCSATDPKNTA